MASAATCSPSSGIPRRSRSTATMAQAARPRGAILPKLIAQVQAAWKKAKKPYQAHIPYVGSLSITVPGPVHAWFALHERFGKLPIATDLAPAIGYATHGFPVTQLIALYWKGNMAAFEKDKALIEELDNARATYLIDGSTPEEGEVFRNPDLGHTLTVIAEQGRDGFYRGPIAHTIDAYFQRTGGTPSYDDFASHHSEWGT